MLKQFYKYMAAFLLVGLVVSCSPDALDVPLTEGDVPVEVTGMLTRALGDATDPGHGELITTGNPLKAYRERSFYLSARTTDATPANYFLNQKITIGTNQDEGRNELDGTVYYPLGQKEIDLTAHTGGTATDAGVITLNAGTTQTNDYLFGKGTDDTGVVVSGKSDDPIEYITFKHLMTRVDVKIEVAGDIVDTKPTSMTIEFARSGANGAIVNRGNYNIFSGGNATNSANGAYAFSDISTTLTTHYLVPNGANLTEYTEQIISSLRIDDYVADSQDLQDLRFPKTDKGNDFILNPGLAYELTFVINRLKIVDIQLTLKDWTTVEANTDWDYDPYTVTLNTGTEYDNNADQSKISKMVLLHTNTAGETYQYIGAGKLEDEVNKIDFVTLPDNLSGDTLTAALYTEQGLLAYNMGITISGNDFTVLDMGKYGMKKASDTEGDYFEVSTSLQLGQLISDKNKTEGERYVLVDDLDMEHTTYAITPASFPAGSILDGNGHDIIHLEVKGNGVFTDNYGTLRNVRIASGLIEGTLPNTPMGAICQVNHGVIEAVVNQAYIQPAEGHEIVGGIAGENGENGTILATVNTGDVLGGTTVGGIVGENKNPSAGAIKASINIGLLNKEATTLGGIIGTSVVGTTDDGIVNTCAWLTGTARKDQSISNELAVGNDPEGGTDDMSADLAASRIRSTEAIGILNGASGGWEFNLIENRSSWPIALSKPD